MKQQKQQKQYMAVDQHGQVVHGLTHPRKDLLARLGRKHADKVYHDNPLTGEVEHVGYIVAGRWFDIYEVKRCVRKV